jgi:hypothetical protein
MFIFREDNKIETTKDLEKWRKNRGDYDFFACVAFSAAKSYSLQNRKKFKLELGKVALGLATAKKEDLERLTKAWKDSQEYGATQIPGKKKVVKKV